MLSKSKDWDYGTRVEHSIGMVYGVADRFFNNRLMRSSIISVIHSIHHYRVKQFSIFHSFVAEGKSTFHSFVAEGKFLADWHLAALDRKTTLKSLKKLIKV